MWKRRLSIFILLAILAARIPSKPAPVKSAAPVQIFLPYIHNTVPVVISESTCIRQKYSGSLIGRGNVMNISDQPVYNVKIQGNFIDSNGQVITTTAYTAFTPTLSMQRNPFEIGSCGPIKIVSWTWESSAEFLPLTIVSTDISPSYSSVSVLFRNDNSVPLKNVIGISWSLNQLGFPGDSHLKDTIEPGETISDTRYFELGQPPFYVLGMGSVDP
jgi:hypothetical protein